jgi:dephospho-CoA kinase
MPVEEKRDRADYVIDTSGTMEQTLQRADAVLERLLKDAEKDQRQSAKTRRRKG